MSRAFMSSTVSDFRKGDTVKFQTYYAIQVIKGQTGGKAVDPDIAGLTLLSVQAGLLPGTKSSERAGFIFIPPTKGSRFKVQEKTIDLKSWTLNHWFYESSSLEMTIRWTSDGPSPIRRVRNSRYHRSRGSSLASPMPP